MSPDPTSAADRKGAKPETRPFSIRLTEAEKTLLLARAGRVPLGTYIRDTLLSGDVQVKRRRMSNPVADHTALARVLAALGQSRLSSNLNQLAKAVNIGGAAGHAGDGSGDCRSLPRRIRHARRSGAGARPYGRRRAMILKGSKRGGSVDLGRHLLKPENEHVEIHEVRGFVSDNVIDALREAYAISRGTKCSKFLFSLSLSPPETENVPIKAFEDAIETIEAKLGLTDQARVVIFHEKEGRRHAHCVWSRINADTMTAIDLPHFKLKLQDIARKLYLEHGWKMPDGLLDSTLRNPLNFDRKEWFQAKRTGQDPRIIKAFFQQCWAASDSSKALRQALEQRGYFLARGDRRAVVAADVHGEVYAVARWANVKSKDVVNRMGDDIAALPSVDEAHERIAGMMRQKLHGFVGNAVDEFRNAAQAMEAKRLAMVERHRAARRGLQTRQDERWIEEARERSERFRRGVRGLWDRLTGKHTKLRQRNEEATTAATVRDANEKQALIERQLDERRQLQREIMNARRVHTHEITRLHREISDCIAPDSDHRLTRTTRQNLSLKQDSLRMGFP